MSLKGLVFDKDWDSFLEYLEEEEKKAVTHSMGSANLVEVHRGQGKYQFIKQLKSLKEKMKAEERVRK